LVLARLRVLLITHADDVLLLAESGAGCAGFVGCVVLV
jgi:hypothetical protein